MDPHQSPVHPHCATPDAAKRSPATGSPENTAGSENVIQRLRRRADHARRLGLEVRAEYLDGQAATWCQIGDRRIVFIDLSQSAAEQLEQLNETLASFQQSQVAAGGQD